VAVLSSSTQIAFRAQVYHGTKVRDEQQSATGKQLKLSGLVREANAGGYIKISNPIYRHAFDEAWIQQKRNAYFVERKTKSVTPNGYLKLSYQFNWLVPL
jgi:hypothetical protein